MNVIRIRKVVFTTAKKHCTIKGDFYNRRDGIGAVQ